MKFKAIVLVMVLVTHLSCKPSKLYATVNEAFTESLGHAASLRNLGDIDLGQISATDMIFECTRQTLQDMLVSEGVHPGLAYEIKLKTKKPTAQLDFKIRLIKPKTFKIDKNTIQMITCGYRLAGNGKLHFICIASQGFVNQDAGMEAVLIKDMKAGLLLMFHQNKDKYRSFHAFNSLGYAMLHRLGSIPPNQQKQLDDFFDGASAEKQKQWQDIYKHKDDPFMVKLFKNGITHFTSHSDVDLVEGIEEALMKEYTEHLIKKLHVPQSAAPKFRDEIELAALGEKGEWKELEFMFKDANGGGKYTMILTVQDQQTMDYDFLIVDIKATFQLGEDVIIYTKTKKILFGLWSKQEIVVERRPATLNEQTIKFMFNFFKCSAIESFEKFRRGVNSVRRGRI